ncbi:hypothetical protein [Paenibacillus sp. sgz5001063]|uniref:hypothetical protein n=1 Tax=Paenibacillus sp. sgz5001063 TaxID=3242474 RepID=UPI0036D28B56
MSLIKEYLMIVPEEELAEWTNKGWVEDKSFTDFEYYAEAGETVLLGKPATLLDIEPDSLVGKTILDFSSHLGSYGMGGPGFFGLLMERDGAREYLVYTVWASGEYITIDDRVIECHINYNEAYHPWISQWAGESEKNQWDDLSGILKGSVITGVSLTEDELRIEITSNAAAHSITFNKYKDTLPPHGNGEPRKPAFAEGVIGTSIVFCHEYAVLHV